MEADLYIRYVDDIFLIWKDLDQTEDLLSLFTEEAYRLKLVLVQKEKEMINFLNVQIQVSNNTIETTVYRKPEATPVIIPRWSNDRWAYNKAVLRAYITRAISALVI